MADRSADDLVLKLLALRRGWASPSDWPELLSQRERTRKPLLELLVRSGRIPPEEAEALATPLQRQDALKRMVDSEQHFWKRVPERIGKYPVESLAARGGRAVIFRGTREHRPVAIKVLAHAYAFDLEEVERFRRQGEFGMLLDHPNLVKVYDFGWDQVIPFLVMQWVEGQTLSRTVEDDRGLPLEQLIEVIAQSARGMAHAHERRVIHKDLKPDNLLVDRVGHAVVTDFGIARMEGEREDEGSIVGTPAYMSPEQARGERLDRRTDVFSLGASLYECLTRQQPFQSGDRRGTVEAAASGRFRPPRALNPDVPPALERIVLKAMAPKAADRFPSMTAFEQALAAWQGGAGTAPAPEAPSGGWLSRLLGRAPR